MLLLSALFGACDKIDPLPEPAPGYVFADGFETAGADLAELFGGDGSRWTDLQLVHPGGGSNVVELTDAIVAEGGRALRVLAKASDNTLSKAGIEKGGFAAPEGSTLRISARVYLDTEGDIEDLFLLDLECCSCWDPNVPNNQCPGIRLMVREGGYLAIERGKILGSTIVQTAVALPRKEWVALTWEMSLSPGDGGRNRLLISGEQVIDAPGANMPNAARFAAEFAAGGIDFELQQPLAYERFQIGATANPTARDVELFVDEVRLEIVE